MIVAALAVAAAVALFLWLRPAPPSAPPPTVSEAPPERAAPPFNGRFIPNPELHSGAKKKLLPDGPTDRAEFNKRKAEMTREALKTVEARIRYPLWSGPLTENMQYKAPTPYHTVEKGPADAEPSVEIWPEQLYYYRLEPIHLFAAFRDESGPVHPDSLDARTVTGTRPRPEIPLQFTDRGDGVMVATLNLDPETVRRNRGEWGVSVDSYVKGQHRHPHTQFYLMITDATVTGPYHAALEEGSLAVYVGITATASSGAGLEGELWGPKGQPVAYAQARNDHPPLGQSTLKLVFYGKAIRDSGVDGPYTVKNLVLFTNDDNSDHFQTPPVDPGLVTEPYPHTVFTDAPINGNDPMLAEKKKILNEELQQAQAGLYDPNDPIPARPTTVDKTKLPPPQ